ncbi:MAG TPA: TadE/TadG family type IV pilus assembly protein, partial [Sphingobium sp.]|nr:TadE/TadG family type IV pilus assembly protein [Sphingobium sp.]
MTRFFRLLHRLAWDCRGVGVLEFAIVAPILLAMLIGIPALGILFYAQAGLRSTVEDAARYATTWPKPSEADIQARIASNQFGMEPSRIVGPTVSFTPKTSSSSPGYVTITMGYN